MLRKNILFLTPDFNIVCGRSKNVLLLSKVLLEDNWNVNIITNKGDLTNKAKSEGVNILSEQICFQSYNPITVFKSLQRLNKLVKEYNIQILHTHHRYYEVLGYLLKKLYRLEHLKLITTVHSMYSKKHFLINYPSEKIIAVSKYLNNYLVNVCNVEDSKVDVVYNYVNNVEFKMRKDKNNKIYILSIGRFSYEKGFDLVFEALSGLSVMDYKYIIIGEGGEYESLNILAEKYKINIEFVKPQFELNTYYSKCDICIIPSRQEGLSFVALEAGMFSIPVIASNTGGLKEIIQHEETGLLFEAGNYKDLLKAILRYKDNRKQASILGENLNRKIVSEFNKEVFKQKMLNIYYSL
ncbi:MAG: glycosyltransferase family 4 protein [Ignavibacteria bacterium]